MKQGIFFLLSVLMVSVNGIAYAASFDQTLMQARELVEQKVYDKALEKYKEIEDELHKDPGLLIEWARVFTYADKHQQAIGVFEDIRKQYPDREKEIIRELAQQYLWDGQTDKSVAVFQKALDLIANDTGIELGFAQALAWSNRYAQAMSKYDDVLKNNPKDVSALLGKAEVLSWQDKLESAYILYQRVLEIDANNISARLGQARISVWQGYHRKGIKLYLEILRQDPDNPDALEGLGFAYHWNKDDCQAREILKKLLSAYPARQAGRDLFNQIDNAGKPHLSQMNRQSYDSNRLEAIAQGFRYAQTIQDRTAFGSAYEQLLYRQKGHNAIIGHKGGLNLEQQFNEYFQAHSYVYATTYNFNHFTPITTNTWFTILPNDQLRFDLSYDRETFEDITALYDQILVNSGSFSFDIKPNRFWLFSAKYKRSRYSDENNQNTAFAKIEYRINQTPYIKMYYNFYFSDWSEQRSHGYFNPWSIQSNTIGLYASKDLTKKLFIEGQISSGYEVQNPKSSHPTYFGALGLSYRLSRSWRVMARGEYFNALDSNPKRVYSKKNALLQFIYSFGSESAQSYQATQPQRPVGN